MGAWHNGRGYIIFISNMSFMKSFTTLATLIFFFSSLLLQGQPVEEHPLFFLSSMATPERLQAFVKELAAAGTEMEIEELTWEADDQIKSIKFSLLLKGDDKPTTFDYNYNILNEGVVLAIGSTSFSLKPTILFMDIAQLNSLAGEFLVPQKREIRVVSTFEDNSSISAKDLPIYFASINEYFAEYTFFLQQFQADADIATRADHNYKYYYNDQGLDCSFGISYLDMSSKIELKRDDTGMRAIYVYSEQPLHHSAIITTSK